MSTVANIPLPQEHIVSTDFDGGEGVLVDLNSKRYYQLNESAMLVWRCIERKLSTDEIVGEMTRVFDVTPEHAARSLEQLLHSLHSHKLIRDRV